MITEPASTSRTDLAIRRLLAAAFTFLALAALAGTLSAAGLVESSFLHERPAVLGFLTLGVPAAVLWLFASEGEPRLAVALDWVPIGATTLYVASAWPGGLIRSAGAIAALAGLAVFASAVAPLVSAATLTVPRLGVLAALVLLATGLLLDLAVDTSPFQAADRIPYRLAGARSPSITAFSMLVGMSLAEQRLARPRRAATSDVWGLTQVLLFLLGWLVLLAGTALDDLTLLVSNVSLHALAVIVFLVRLSPRLDVVRWTAPDETRWFALPIVFLAVEAGLLAHLTLGVATGTYLQAPSVPEWLTFAVDHVVFIGAILAPLVGIGLTAGPGRHGRARSAAFWVTIAGSIALTAGIATAAEPAAGSAAALLAAAVIVAGATAGGLRPPAGMRPEE